MIPVVTRRVRRLLWAVLTALVAVVAAAGPAGAHLALPDESAEPIAARITSIDANDAVAEFLVVGSLATPMLEAAPGHTVTVLGFNGEPYLRIDGDGSVWANVASATYAANEGDHSTKAIGSHSTWPSPQPGATDTWVQVGAGGVVIWHDHRVHWMAPTPPTTDAGSDAVQQFRFDLVADGQPIEARGELYLNPDVPFDKYKAGPAVTSPGDSGSPLVVAAAVAGGLVLSGVLLGLGVRWVGSAA